MPSISPEKSIFDSLIERVLELKENPLSEAHKAEARKVFDIYPGIEALCKMDPSSEKRLLEITIMAVFQGLFIDKYKYDEPLSEVKEQKDFAKENIAWARDLLEKEKSKEDMGALFHVLTLLLIGMPKDFIENPQMYGTPIRTFQKTPKQSLWDAAFNIVTRNDGILKLSHDISLHRDLKFATLPAYFVLTHSSKIRHLHLLNIKNLGDEDVTTLIDGITKNSSLTTLKLEGGNLENIDLKPLFETLKNHISPEGIPEGGNKALYELSFRNCSIGKSNLTYLSELLKENATIGILDLEGLNIDNIASTLANALKPNSPLPLEHLNLGHTYVGEKGWNELSEAIKSNIKLLTLAVDSKSFQKAEYAYMLFDALKDNKGLASFRCYIIYDCRWSLEPFVQKLAEVLKVNDSLVELDFSRISTGNYLYDAELKDCNNLSKASLKAITEALSVNKRLVELNLRGMYFDGNIQTLREALLKRIPVDKPNAEVDKEAYEAYKKEEVSIANIIFHEYEKSLLEDRVFYVAR